MLGEQECMKPTTLLSSWAPRCHLEQSEFSVQEETHKYQNKRTVLTIASIEGGNRTKKQRIFEKEHRRRDCLLPKKVTCNLHSKNKRLKKPVTSTSLHGKDEPRTEGVERLAGSSKQPSLGGSSIYKQAGKERDSAFPS